ncbi:dermonecrotic toxin domain-containing protein [Pseudomonas sp. LS2P72]
MNDSTLLNTVPAPIPPPLSVHASFIQSKLPGWLVEGSPEQRKTFRACLLKSNAARQALAPVFEDLKNPLNFARTLLSKKLTGHLGSLDAEKSTLLREWKNSHLLGLIKTRHKTTEQTLVDAALQNFEPSEARNGGFEAGSAIYVSGLGEKKKSAVSPEHFARVCRELDIGMQYQRHISETLEPSATAGTTATHSANQIKALIRNDDQNTFEAAIHIALMKKSISTDLYALLLELSHAGSHKDLICSHLTLDGTALPGILLFRDKWPQIKHVLYIPDDPDNAIKRYDSYNDLQTALAIKLDTPPYRKFFNRFIPFERQGTPLTTGTLWSGANRLGNPSFAKPLVRVDIAGDFYETVFKQHIAHLKADARMLAVPTADANTAGSLKKRQELEAAGESLLFFAASFIPIIGEVVLAVTALQLLNSVYHGVAAWSRGDTDEALNDLLDVADAAALGILTAGAIKTTGLATNLVRIRLRNNNERLWHPDLTPYRQALQLPVNIHPNAQGLYHHNAKTYVALEDHFYEVKVDIATQQWQLQHPSDPNGHTPQMLHNGAAGWRHLHENPTSWDELKLIRRLGTVARNIRQEAVEPILLVSGLNKLALTELHLNTERPPALLTDVLKRFDLRQEIKDFKIERSKRTKTGPYSPFILLHLLTTLSGWPTTRCLTVVDGTETLFTFGDPANTTQPELGLTYAQLRNGELIDTVVEKLRTDELNELFNGLAPSTATHAERLAQRLDTHLAATKDLLFPQIYALTEKPETLIQEHIRTKNPTLPKSYLQQLTLSISRQEEQQIVREKQLPPLMGKEAAEYSREVETVRIYEGLYLDSARPLSTDQLILTSLEQLPNWADSVRIEMRDRTLNGKLLSSVGSDTAVHGRVLVREGAQYRAYDAAGNPLDGPADLYNSIKAVLPETQRLALGRDDNRWSDRVKSALNNAIERLHKQPLAIREGTASWATGPVNPGFPLDTLFARQETPTNLSLRADGIYEQPPLQGGMYKYYVLENRLYYQVRYAKPGWQAIDARSPYRAYKPYVRQKVGGGWEIDSDMGLPGGTPGVGSSRHLDIPEETSDSYHSASEYIMPVPFTAAERDRMSRISSFQQAPNTLGGYDRANNGRYPLRDLQGQPLRIKKIQQQAKSAYGGTRYGAAAVKPYIQWEGFEGVANLYEEKLALRKFTAADCKSPEERTLIGQDMVSSKKPLVKGEILGVYGGGLIPGYVGVARKDPFLIDVLPAKLFTPTKRHSVLLSGDNVLSRMNTIFEYKQGKPARQAAAGYNVEAVPFDVEVQAQGGRKENYLLYAFFAIDDIPVDNELRWNYGYNEPAIRALFA